MNEIVYYILEQCKAIYVTHLKKEGAMNKEEAFQKLFCLEGKESLIKQMVPLMLPWDSKIADKTYEVEQLLEGELGAFIHELLE